MGIKSISLAATALVLSTNVNAAIISTDWKVAGDNLITHDTVSGFNWLDLTETNNLSYNAVVAQLGVGGIYEGFRVATSNEVVALWSNFGIDLSSGAPTRTNEGYDSNIAQASSILGNTIAEYNAEVYPAGTIGATSDKYSADIAFNQRMGAFNNSAYNITSYHIMDGTPSDLDYVYIHTGTYLVSSVPVPAAVWLFGSGLLGLVGVARRKKA